jgi:ribonuclease HI
MLARARCAPSAGPLSTGTAVGGYVSAVSRRPRPLRAVNPRGKGATARNATSPGCTRAGGGAEGGAPRNSRKSQPRLPSALAEGAIAAAPAQPAVPWAGPPMVAFTDGSALNNGSRSCTAAYAVVWPYMPHLDFAARLPPPCTNNRAEYAAFIHAMRQAAKLDPGGAAPLLVYTDSQLLVHSVTKWIRGWKARGWHKADGEPVKNVDLLQEIDALMRARPTTLRHVRAHTGAAAWGALHNARADRMARSANALKR